LKERVLLLPPFKLQLCCFIAVKEPGKDASEDQQHAWDALKATRVLVPFSLAVGVLLLLLGTLAIGSSCMGNSCLCNPQAMSHWVLFVAIAGVVLSSSAVGSYATYINLTNDELAGGDGNDLDGDAKWKPGKGADILAGSLSMALLAACIALLGSLAACACLPQGCCVKAQSTTKAPLLG
jgi:hypothetical protein